MRFKRKIIPNRQTHDTHLLPSSSEFDDILVRDGLGQGIRVPAHMMLISSIKVAAKHEVHQAIWAGDLQQLVGTRVNTLPSRMTSGFGAVCPARARRSITPTRQLLCGGSPLEKLMGCRWQAIVSGKRQSLIQSVTTVVGETTTASGYDTAMPKLPASMMKLVHRLP
jgi:hypothetical protein